MTILFDWLFQCMLVLLMFTVWFCIDNVYFKLYSGLKSVDLDYDYADWPESE